MIIEYDPQGVCSKHFTIEIDGTTITKVSIIGGCPGNLQGISALLVGMDIHDAIKRLENIPCRSKNTSCPDQIAKALKTAFNA